MANGPETTAGRRCRPLRGQEASQILLNLVPFNPGLSYIGHFGPRIGRPRALRTGAEPLASETRKVLLITALHIR